MRRGTRRRLNVVAFFVLKNQRNRDIEFREGSLNHAVKLAPTSIRSGALESHKAGQVRLQRGMAYIRG